MTDPVRTRAQLQSLAEHLAQRREALLEAWRLATDLDSEVSSAATSTRTQFVDHIPAVLDAFEDRLRARSADEKAEARVEQKEWAAEHGTHRWQQGYQLTETMREWGHLQMAILAELERYGVQNPELEEDVLQVARRELVRLANDGVCASASRYTELQQSEAASRLYDLETALETLQTIEMDRAEGWRQAAHDLRGSAHVIVNASAVLNRENLPDAKRLEVSQTLSVAATSLNALLSDLLDHARLEAGHERRTIREFDVASAIKTFCESARSLAAERNLFLKCEGPATLLVQGDSVKIQRILQNLVLNALKATQSGGVRVTWEASESPEANQWALCVQDTGPGLVASELPIKRELKEATEGVREVEDDTAHPPDESLQATAPPTLTSKSAAGAARQPVGEGIGLSIVKRLCELLDASIELQTASGQGTTFRVIFPLRYPA
ncbi:MAG TPA: sensor histidine kinase [Steroidobacteraceae bacterium]